MRDRVINARRDVFTGVALFVVASVLGFPIISPSSGATMAPQRISVPAYFWPGSNWDATVARAGVVDIVVLNVDSGPGVESVSSFVATVAAARARGIRVVGYVHTSYGLRSLTEVLTEIDRYSAWYGVDGVFVDEVPGDCAQSAYYDAVEARARSYSGAIVVTNPGMNPQECATAFSDIIVNFEGTAASYQSWSPAAWTNTYPADRFWHLVYGAGGFDIGSLVSLSQSRNAGHIYVTDDVFPNPWDTLPGPTMWSDLFAHVGGRAAAPGATPGPTGLPRSIAPIAGPSPVPAVPAVPTQPASEATNAIIVLSEATVAIRTQAPQSPPIPLSAPTAPQLPQTPQTPQPTNTSMWSGETPVQAVPDLLLFAPTPLPSDVPSPVALLMASSAGPVPRVSTRTEPVRVAVVPTTSSRATPGVPGEAAVARLLVARSLPQVTIVRAKPARPAPCPRRVERALACAATAVAIR